MRIHFPNGYGASVIDTGYGSRDGLFELAVLADGKLCYTTPITSDVLGWLTADDVDATLAAIEALPSLHGQDVEPAEGEGEPK